jgi:hypothetical protein
MVFNCAAKLTEDLVRRGKSVLPAGTTLFVTTENKKDYYCLPRAGFIGSQSLCFADSSDDGRLDHQSNGGTPLNGVYMYADGFYDRGAVLAPLRPSLIWKATSSGRASCRAIRARTKRRVR